MSKQARASALWRVRDNSPLLVRFESPRPACPVGKEFSPESQGLGIDLQGAGGVIDGAAIKIFLTEFEQVLNNTALNLNSMVNI